MKYSLYLASRNSLRQKSLFYKYALAKSSMLKTDQKNKSIIPDSGVRLKKLKNTTVYDQIHTEQIHTIYGIYSKPVI